jgi:hypothetical protein
MLSTTVSPCDNKIVTSVIYFKQTQVIHRFVFMDAITQADVQLK